MAIYLETTDGKVLDVVNLYRGKLQYKTGVATPIFEGKRMPGAGTTDEDLYDWFQDWSNGYLVTKPSSSKSWLEKAAANIS